MQNISLFRQNKTLAILSGQSILVSMGVGAINPILPQYAKTFGVNVTLIGLIITVFGITRFLTDIPTGRLNIKFGSRPILITGAILLGISALFAALIGSYWGLIISWGLQGVGAALFIVSSMIILAEISRPADRGQVMSTFQGCQLIGTGIGPVMGGFVAQAWGYQQVFIVFAILSFLCSLLSYFQVHGTIHQESVSLKSPDQRLSERQIAATRSGIRPLLLDHSFALVSLVTLGIFIMRIAAQNQILPLLGQDRMGLSSGQIGMAMMVIVIFQFIATLIGGRLSDRFGRKIIITSGGLISALSLLVLAQSYTFEILLFSCIAMGIGVGMAGSAALAFAVDITPRSNYDASMGLYRAITDISFVVGPILMGWLADTGGFGLALLFNCLFLFVITVIFQIFGRALPKNRTSSETQI